MSAPSSQRQDGGVEVAAVLQFGVAGAGPAGVGQVDGETALAVDLDEQLGQGDPREAGHHRVALGQDVWVDDLGGQGLEVELAVGVDTDRAVGVGEQGLEVVEVAAHLVVDGDEAFGEGSRHAGELKDFRSLRRPRLGGDEVGGRVGVAPRPPHPDLARAQAALEGEQHAQLPVVLEEVLVAGGPGRVEVGAPAGRDEVDRGA
jgi:hypothetical protein